MSYSKIKWGGLLLISVLYIINPGSGVLEIIPDNFPIIGNLDEAGAVLLAIKAWKELKNLKK